MRLLTVGDSFTYGEELENKEYSWPCLLARSINFELTNLARPSKSNTYILRKVIENYLDYDLVIVAWSHFARLEFSDNIGTFDIWPGCNKYQAEFSKFRTHIIEYITLHHDDQYLYNQYLINIILLQNFLKLHNKKYVMLDTFGNTKFRNLNTDLIKQIDTTNYLGWPDESMMEWTYGCPQGPGGHFLEQGHERVADKIYEHTRNLGWIS